MQTIDYSGCIELVDEPDEEKLWDDLHDIGFGNQAQIISYNQDLIVMASAANLLIGSSHNIEMDCFCRGVYYIAKNGNTEIFEDYLEKTNNNSIEADLSDDHLPEITDYIVQYPDAFKTVYYPGAGQDFSPLQLFGNHAHVQSIYFTDYENNLGILYSNDPKVTDVRDRLDERAENVTELSPKDFDKKQWADFWPQESDAWAGIKEAFLPSHHPVHAWGRRVTFNQHQKSNHAFDFYYLGTEGVKTAEVLIENGTILNVLVLQDHGFGGNWSVFGGADSPLYRAMEQNLPKYILAELNSNIEMWPGYEQVTRTYNPPLHAAHALHRNVRALFKRIK
jgi:hypothetical protein